MGFWDKKRVLVTGGAGFVGSHVVEELLRRGRGVKVTVADDLSLGRRANLAGVEGVVLKKTDLTDAGSCLKACRGQDVVLHLAAKVGGVGFNAAHPAAMFRDNVALSLAMAEGARRAMVERILVVSSACVYRRDCPVPTQESEGFVGWPEDTNEGYGWAKRMAEFLAMAYRKEFGLRAAIARPYNSYGPRDHFDTQSGHVIPSLIKRVAAGEDPVRVWGDGTQTRAFLYVEDLARGLVDLTERYAECDPVNLGPTEEVSIAELVKLILKAAGSRAKVAFDTSKPSGQPRRDCDSSKARSVIAFEPKVGLEEGLRRTVAWYKENEA